jgi:hypothetical protein
MLYLIPHGTCSLLPIQLTDQPPCGWGIRKPEVPEKELLGLQPIVALRQAIGGRLHENLFLGNLAAWRVRSKFGPCIPAGHRGKDAALQGQSHGMGYMAAVWQYLLWNHGVKRY